MTAVAAPSIRNGLRPPAQRPVAIAPSTPPRPIAAIATPNSGLLTPSSRNASTDSESNVSSRNVTAANVPIAISSARRLAM